MKKVIFSLLSLLAISSVMQAQTISVAGDVEALASGETVSFNLHIADVTAMTSMHFEVELPSGFIVSSVSATSEWPAMFSREGGVIGAISSSDNALTGEGDIATVQIEVPVNTETGTYPITVDHVRVNGTELETTAQFNVVVVNAHTVILDETSTTAPEAATGVDVRVKRTILANQWSTICLPFAMTEAQVKEAFGNDVELGDFDGIETTYEDEDESIVSGIKVKFNTVTAIEANHPYIIKVDTPVSEFTVDNVDIIVEEIPSVDKDEYSYQVQVGKNKYETRYMYNSFVGTYAAETEIPEKCLFLSDNKFWYSTGLTKSKGFRAYFEFYEWLPEAELSSAHILISLDNEVTGIDATLGNSEIVNGEERYYNLNGQRVEKPKKGMYIINNKKVVVK